MNGRTHMPVGMLRFSCVNTLRRRNCPIGTGRRKWQGGKWKPCARSVMWSPQSAIHEASQLRCCLTVAAPGCRKGRPKGASGGNQLRPIRGTTGGKLGHIFEQGAQFHEPPAVASLCGVKAPVWPIAMDMTTPSALRRFGLCVACLKACPDPAHLFYPRHAYLAYVVPTDVLGRMNVAVGTS